MLTMIKIIIKRHSFFSWQNWRFEKFLMNSVNVWWLFFLQIVKLCLKNRTRRKKQINWVRWHQQQAVGWLMCIWSRITLGSSPSYLLFSPRIVIYLLTLSTADEIAVSNDSCKNRVEKVSFFGHNLQMLLLPFFLCFRKQQQTLT